MNKLIRFEKLESRRLLNIDFPSFNSRDGLNLLGDATLTDNDRLRLTDASRSQIGAAWYVEEKQLVSVDFQTDFDFRMSSNGSHGLAFAIQNAGPEEMKASAGNLGYNGLANSFVIEMRTSNGASTISVRSNGSDFNFTTDQDSLLESFNTRSRGIRLNDGETHSLKIRYMPGLMSVLLDDIQNPIIQLEVNLGELLELDHGRAWVGFTAATHINGTQVHEVSSWKFETLADTTTTIGVLDAASVEQDAGESHIRFVVSRQGDVSAASAFDWSIGGGTAAPGSDFIADRGTIVFAPGEIEKQIELVVFGDQEEEQSETIELFFSNPNGGTLLSQKAIGTILNDDTAISFKSDIVVEEGANGYVFERAIVPRHGGGLDGGHHIAIGTDENLYVASGGTNAILRYDGRSGEFLGEFVPSNSGGLNNPHGLRFGPDNNLYVASKLGDEILRYDGRTGDFIDVFANTRENGIDQTVDLVFSPDGFLYVSGGRTDNVLKFDGTTGEFIQEIVPSGTPGLDEANGLAIGPDGNLYVASTQRSKVLRFDPMTGEFLGDFVTSRESRMQRPRAISFAADGYFYVASDRGAIHRFDSVSGEYLGDIVTRRLGGLELPVGFAFDSQEHLHVVSIASDEVLSYVPQSQARFEVTLSTPLGISTSVEFKTVSSDAVADVDFENVSNTIEFAPGVTSRSIFVPIINDGHGELTESFVVELTDPTTGVLGLSSATAEIQDNDRFVVGDSNFDGVFDSADLVRVFIVGEYEDDLPGNSTFADGDWNGDGDFTTSDLVFAFQAGAYVAAAVIEPVLADMSFAKMIEMIDEGQENERTSHLLINDWF